jgi:hypothetical protein
MMSRDSYSRAPRIRDSLFVVYTDCISALGRFVWDTRSGRIGDECRRAIRLLGSTGG